MLPLSLILVLSQPEYIRRQLDAVLRGDGRSPPR